MLVAGAIYRIYPRGFADANGDGVGDRAIAYRRGQGEGRVLAALEPGAEGPTLDLPAAGGEGAITLHLP